MTNISQATVQLLCKQYVKESENHYFYKGLENLANVLGLDGVAKFFKSQAQGEHEHAQKIFEYLSERNQILTCDFMACKYLPRDSGLLEIFEAAMITEEETTQKLKALYIQASQEGDVQTSLALIPLITEQTEEESLTQTILDRIEVRIGNSTAPDNQEIVTATEQGAAVHDLDLWIGGLV